MPGRSICPGRVATPFPSQSASSSWRRRALRSPEHERVLWNIASRVLMVLLAVGGLLAFYETLRRYSVGSAGRLLFLNGPWHPVEGDALAVVWYGVAIALLVGLLWMLPTRDRHRTRTPLEQVGHAVDAARLNVAGDMPVPSGHGSEHAHL